MMSSVTTHTTSAITCEIIRDAQHLAALSPEWEALVNGSQYEAFTGPHWFAAWKTALPVSSLACVTARRDGQLVGVLPFGRRRSGFRNLFMSIDAPFASGDYLAPIVREEFVDDVLPLMLRALRTHLGQRTVLWWPNVPCEARGYAALRRYLDTEGMQHFEEHEVAPRLRIEGRSYAELEASWSKSLRTDVRRQTKRLEALGNLELHEPSTREEALATLEEFFEVHDEKWRSQGFPGLFETEAQRRLYREIVGGTWGGQLYFTTLRLDGRNISFGIAFRAGGWVQWYRPSYRAELENYSPGKVHVAMVIRDAVEAGMTGMDFLLGGEKYKYQWTNEEGRVASICAARSPWAPKYAWFATIKPFMRNRLAARLAWLLGKVSRVRARFAPSTRPSRGERQNPS